MSYFSKLNQDVRESTNNSSAVNPAQGNFLPISVPFYASQFSNGLFLVIATQNASVTVIYE